GLTRKVLRTADGRVDRHVPENLGAAGIRAADDAHRRAFGEYADRTEKAGGDADLRAVRDHGLLSLAAAIGIANIQRKVGPLEQAGLEPDTGDERFAKARAANLALKFVSRATRAQSGKGGECRKQCNRQACTPHVSSRAGALGRKS